MSDIAIKVENLSKYYRLGVINSGTLGKDLQSWLWKKMGKEDPNRMIGLHDNEDADGFWALKDINFEIKKGERVGIIGKNGAGKSTLLKMLSQISAPTEGRIYMNGKVSSLLEVGTGFNGELTGRENIYMNGAILGMKKREIDAKIDEIIAFSEITRHIDTPVKRYSSGMYVRLAFAVAAHLDSDILIADEVLAVGDANFQKKAIGKMNELSSGQGRTILFVSHNMEFIKRLCHRGIVLEKGKLVRDDSDVNDSVAWYLGENIEKHVESKKLVWTNADKKVYDSGLSPQTIEIIDSAGNVVDGHLNYEKSYTIKFVADIVVPDRLVVFGFRICKQTDIIFSFGVGLDEVIYRSGINVFTFDIPPRTILPGAYSMKLSASRWQINWISNADNNDIVLNFTVDDPSNKIIKLGTQ